MGGMAATIEIVEILAVRRAIMHFKYCPHGAFVDRFPLLAQVQHMSPTGTAIIQNR
jgi:hypothetical protein